ncbi:MAG TPA: glutamine-synthetase adenylyltransferase [Aquificales bacterium]|nr:glutamine-synthetase adenylyltransferase [Aquificales bacterium]
MLLERLPKEWIETAKEQTFNWDIVNFSLEEILKNHPHPQTLIEYLNPRRFVLLAKILDQSSCLRKFLIKHPTAFEENLPGLWYRFKNKKTYLRELEKFKNRFGDISELLAFYRHYELLRIFSKELLGTATLEEILAEYSHLADALVEYAYGEAYRKFASLYGEPVAPSGEKIGGLILGLGKLGSEELNYYSDIDLIFLHERDDGKAGSLSAVQFYEKVFKETVSILTKITPEGKPYEVDLDLRPFGKSGPLTMSLVSAETYYESYGRVWERFALLRARHVAGEKRLYDWFWENVQLPFVYKQPADPKVIEEIRLMKKKLETLTKKRTLTQINIKTCKGGIRELEFTVQALQILLGKDSPLLRERNTFRAIWKLHQKGIFSDEEAYNLEKAYIFLRKLEHRLQLKECIQTQNLKKSDVPFLVKALELRDEDHFWKVFNRHTEAVHTAFENLLPERKEKLSPVAEAVISGDPERLEKLYSDIPSWTVERVVLTLNSIWEGGEGIHLTEREKENFLKWVDYIVEKILRSPLPETTLSNMVRFLQNPTGRKLFFLQPSERLYETLFRIFSVSSYLTNKIYVSPDLVEDILTLYKDYPTREEIERDLEEFKKTKNLPYADLIRRFEKSWTIRIALIFISDPNKSENINRLFKAFTDLTEVVLTDIWKELGFEGIPLALFALGKFGSGELTLASDLDLVFAFADAEAKNRYIKKPQELVRFVTSHTAEGYLYKVDFRLRPMGTKGELAPTLDYFEEYFKKYARTWERLAWVRSRFIVGDREVGEKLNRLVEEFLFGKPLTEREEREIYEMRLKLQEHSKDGRNRYDIKAGFGGLMDIEFLVQYLLLKKGKKIENTFEALEYLSEEYKPLEDLKGVYKFFRLLETVNRLVKPSGGSVINVNDLPKIGAVLNISPEGLEEEIKKNRKLVRETFLEFLGK